MGMLSHQSFVCIAIVLVVSLSVTRLSCDKRSGREVAERCQGTRYVASGVEEEHAEERNALTNSTTYPTERTEWVPATRPRTEAEGPYGEVWFVVDAPSGKKVPAGLRVGVGFAQIRHGDDVSEIGAELKWYPFGEDNKSVIKLDEGTYKALGGTLDLDGHGISSEVKKFWPELFAIAPGKPPLIVRYCLRNDE